MTNRRAESADAQPAPAGPSPRCSPGWRSAGCWRAGRRSSRCWRSPAPVGTIWLRALQMTIVPLVAALLVTGIAQMVATARAGPMARRTLLTFFAVLAAGTRVRGVRHAGAARGVSDPGRGGRGAGGRQSAAQPVPGIGAFFESLVAAQRGRRRGARPRCCRWWCSSSRSAVAITRLPEAQRDLLLGLFEALGNAMLTIIGWVLWLAPVGVFALALAVGCASGGGAFAALGALHPAGRGLGFVVLVAGYALGGARRAASARCGSPARCCRRRRWRSRRRARSPACRRCSQSCRTARRARDHRRLRAAARGGDVPRDQPGDEPRRWRSTSRS